MCRLAESSELVCTCIAACWLRLDIGTLQDQHQLVLLFSAASLAFGLMPYKECLPNSHMPECMLLPVLVVVLKAQLWLLKLGHDLTLVGDGSRCSLAHLQ